MQVTVTLTDTEVTAITYAIHQRLVAIGKIIKPLAENDSMLPYWRSDQAILRDIEGKLWGAA